MAASYQETAGGRTNDSFDEEPADRVRIVSEIDAGLNAITKLQGFVEFSHSVTDLNLHSNALTTMKGVGALSLLVNLNLSSNFIEKMDSDELWQCTRLTRLNLACNCITEIDGLSGLQSLQYLNVAHNQIHSLEAMKQCSPAHVLKDLDLKGNRIDDLEELLALKRCPTLRQLTLARKGKLAAETNQICALRGYLQVVERCLPELALLDGENFMEKMQEARRQEGNGIFDEETDLLHFVKKMKADAEVAMETIDRELLQEDAPVSASASAEEDEEVGERDAEPASQETRPRGKEVKHFMDAAGKKIRVKEIKTDAIERAALRVRNRLVDASPRRANNSKMALPRSRRRGGGIPEEMDYLQNEIRLQRLETRMAIIQSTKARHRQMRRMKQDSDSAAQARDTSEDGMDVQPTANPWRKSGKPSKLKRPAEYPALGDKSKRGERANKKLADPPMQVYGRQLEDGAGRTDAAATTFPLDKEDSAAVADKTAQMEGRLKELEGIVASTQKERDELQAKLADTAATFNRERSSLEELAKAKEETLRLDMVEAEKLLNERWEKRFKAMEDDREDLLTRHKEAVFSLEQAVQASEMKRTTLEQQVSAAKEYATVEAALSAQKQASEIETRTLKAELETSRKISQLQSSWESEKIKLTNQIAVQTQRAERAEGEVKHLLENTKRNAESVEKDWTQQRQHLNERLEQLKRDSEQEKVELRDKLHQSEARATGLAEQLVAFEAKATEDMNGMTSVIKTLKEELAAREKMIININGGLQKAQAEARDTYRGFHDKNNRLRAALEQVQAAFEQSTQSCASLKRTLQITEEKEERATSLIRDLKAVVEDQRATIRVMEKEKNSVDAHHKAEVEQLRAESNETETQALAVLKSHLKEAEAIVEQKTLENGKIQTEKHVLMERIQFFEKSAKKSEEESKNSMEKVLALQKRIKQCDEVIKCMEEEKSTLTRVKDTMLADKEDTITQLKEELETVKGNMADYRARAHNSEDDLAAVEDQLASALQIREEMETIIDNLRSELDADNVDGIRAELQKKEDAIQKVETEMEKIRPLLTKLQADLKYEKNCVKELTAEKGNVRSQLASANRQRDETAKAMESLQTECRAKNDLIHSMQQTVDRLTASEANARENARAAKSELNGLHQRLNIQREQAQASLKQVTTLYETMLGSP